MLRLRNFDCCSELSLIKESSLLRFIEIVNSIFVSEDKPALWVNAKDKDGYGRYSVSLKDGTVKQYRAHRLSYLCFVGELEEGKVVCHRLDIPEDVNPFNLFLGTPLDNNRDMLVKGHYNFEVSASLRRKFSEEDVRQIRKLNEEGLGQIKIAHLFNTRREYIRDIIKRKTYKHIL